MKRPSGLCRWLKIQTFALVVVLTGAALPFPGRVAYASPGTAKEPVDTVAGKPRYRAWNKPRFPPDEADMEISSGLSSFEGTPNCAAWTYTFTRGDTTYTLGALSTCKGDEPRDARAKVTVAVLGKTKRSWWCY